MLQVKILITNDAKVNYYKSNRNSSFIPCTFEKLLNKYKNSDSLLLLIENRFKNMRRLLLKDISIINHLTVSTFKIRAPVFQTDTMKNVNGPDLTESLFHCFI